MERRVQILTETEVKRALMRLSYEIIEKSEDLDKVVLAGIHTRGIPIAEIIRNNIEKHTGKRLPICTLDITFYRDDLSKKGELPEVKGSIFPVDINGKEVIIIDDYSQDKSKELIKKYSNSKIKLLIIYCLQSTIYKIIIFISDSYFFTNKLLKIYDLFIIINIQTLYAY